MATILPFRRIAPSNFSRPAAAKGKAEIVIFPGVRYERWDDLEDGRETGQGPRQARRRRRDKR